ncbi:MerR family transcriptional regulator [Latilactobacillus sakei]|uniref:MerR family transcriptional regulator n=1 Tax=Latilactobacillus sakei TaxID=1599 RepID=UPI001F283E0B|nr:MerR family transcriptional regulator [Latilactobacillus sakei]MCE8502111.1 MerR family transcriptional regulator [Latilactobacillus sakei]
MNIKEASQQTGVTATTIRYYEKEGLIPAIDRNDVGVRAIDDRIIRRINFVKTMRAAGMSIEALKEYIRLFDAQEDNTAQQFKLLNEQIAIMAEKRDDLQTAIDHLRWKVDHYEDHMAVTAEELRAVEKNRADQ